MNPEDLVLVQEIDWHLKCIAEHLTLLTTYRTQNGTPGEIYLRLAKRFARTIELAHGEFEYGLVAYLDGRLPGPTEENDAANTLGRGESSQQENLSSQIENSEKN